MRNASGVVYGCAGPIWMSLLDAVTGFNHIANTRRARDMLAILARSGQFLLVCMTFGPQNGPEDFSYVVDRFYSPGRDAKRRYCTEWQAYVDDLTVRTGVSLTGNGSRMQSFRSASGRRSRTSPWGVGRASKMLLMLKASCQKASAVKPKGS